MPAPADRLLLEGLEVLSVVARRIGRRLGNRISVDDLMALGRPALLEIARAYDPSRASFAAYAALRLKWAIIDGVRRETQWRSELARATALAASERYAEAERDGEVRPDDDPDACRRELGELLAGHAAAMTLGLSAGGADQDGAFADAADSPEERASQVERSGAVRRAVRGLPERERALIERHYFGDERFDHIAQDLGISKSRACRLHARAIEALGQVLRDSDG